MHNHNLVGRNAKLLSNDLGKGGLFALSMRGGTGVDHDGSALFNAHTRAFIETYRRGTLWPEAADLNVGRQTNAHQLPIPIGAHPGLF